MEIKDSGSRREFETGAVRDDGGGKKGRMDLVPLGVIGSMMCDMILINLDVYIQTGNRQCLVDAFKKFAKENYENLETAMLEVSIHYQDGCKKYGERNWEKGIPLHSFIDSAARHYIKHRRGDVDEPHDKAFMWNLLGALWTHANKPEMIDLPFVENINAEENDKLAFLASNMSEEELNKFVSMWQKYHSEEPK